MVVAVGVGIGRIGVRQGGAAETTTHRNVWLLSCLCMYKSSTHTNRNIDTHIHTFTEEEVVEYKRKREVGPSGVQRVLSFVLCYNFPQWELKSGFSVVSRRLL